MSLKERELFTFTWRIKNFSMCPQYYEEKIESQMFAVNMLEKTEWYLQLYPRGLKTENYISCYLYYAGTGSYSGDITIGYELIAISAGGTELNKKRCESHKFGTKTCWGWDTLCARDAVWARRKEYLLNDTFAVQCNMWRVMNDTESPATDALDIACLYPSDFESALQREMFCSAARDDLFDFRTQLGSNRVSVRTTVNVIKKTIDWPIRKFHSLRINQRISIPLIHPLVDAPSFFLTVYKTGSSNEDQFAEVEIRRCETDCSRHTFSKCKITVLNTLKNDAYFSEEEHFFDADVTDDVWKFQSFIKASKLNEESYFDTTHDVLLLRCEFAFSQIEELYHSVDLEPIALPDQRSLYYSNKQILNRNVLKFYKDGEFSDVILRVSGRDFKVHKIILSAMSSVFHAMFNHDMKEKKTGVVVISDCNPDTVDRMLSFMYTDTLEDLKPGDVIELYSAADKYQVLPLKLQCSHVLKSTLSLSNVCDVLKLADLHYDQDLSDTVENFISTNFYGILQSSEWKDLMKCNSSLAADVMYKILMRNVE